jgi:hypothetical protein
MSPELGAAIAHSPELAVAVMLCSALLREAMKQPVERRLAAILAADVAGYSRLMGLDEEGTHELMRLERGAKAVSSIPPPAPNPGRLRTRRGLT